MTKVCSICTKGEYKGCPHCNKDIILCHKDMELKKPDQKACKVYKNYKKARQIE